MATIPITKRGAEKLKEELHRLKTIERPAVITAIAEARAQGDLSENADYDAAKDRQGFIEGRIQEIEGKLSVAQVIDPSAVDGGGKVVFGATVELEDEDTGDLVKYQIVGEDEADLKQGLINISSPIARALIGKEEGDTAEVQAPGGIRRYEVVAGSYVCGQGCDRAPFILGCRLGVGQPHHGGAAGGALVVCTPAHARDGGNHGCQAVCGADLGVRLLRLAPVTAFKTKRGCSALSMGASSYAFHSRRHAARLGVAIRRSPPHRGEAGFAALAHRRFGAVWLAVAVCFGGATEDATAGCGIARQCPAAVGQPR